MVSTVGINHFRQTVATVVTDDRSRMMGRLKTPAFASTHAFPVSIDTGASYRRVHPWQLIVTVRRGSDVLC